MQESTSRPSQAGKENTPEKIRTPPLPPQKLNTVPYPSSEVPSTSLLLPPSLSLTAATPDVSPISPTQHTPAKKPSIDPLVSVLRAPATPSAPRQTSRFSYKGKRKADEAGVEGGGTPPKETKEPRATFAVGPRRKSFP